MNQFLVKLGRSDDETVKALFFGRRKEAVNVANSVAFWLWGYYPFKMSECHESVVVENEGLWIEFKPEGGDL